MTKMLSLLTSSLLMTLLRIVAKAIILSFIWNSIIILELTMLPTISIALMFTIVIFYEIFKYNNVMAAIQLDIANLKDNTIHTNKLLGHIGLILLSFNPNLNKSTLSSSNSSEVVDNVENNS